MSIKVDAFADKPRREDYESEAAFQADLKEWEENQVVPRMSEHDWDAEHGPAYDEKLKGAHPDHGYADDVEHGPAFDTEPKGHTDDVEHGPGVQ